MAPLRFFLLGTCLMALTNSASSIDAVFWNFDDSYEINTDFSKLVDSASPKNPLAIFVVNEFELADFSKLANVYAGNEQSQIPGIVKSLSRSKGYSAEWIDEDVVPVLEGLRNDEFVLYDDDTPAYTLNTATRVIVLASDLKEIDEKVDKVMSKLNARNYRAVLTGKREKSSSQIESRKKREIFAVSDSITPIIMTQTNACLFYLGFPAITVIVPPDDFVWVPIVNSTTPVNITTSTNCTNGTAAFNIVYTGGTYTGTTPIPGPVTNKVTVTNLGISMTMANMADTWILTSVTITSITYQVNALTAQTMPSSATNVLVYPFSSVATFSYACSHTKVFWVLDSKGTHPVYGVDFNKFQVQPFKMTNNQFSLDVDDCVGFFTPGIWMAIFAGIILLTIFSFGIAMISNLKTMDRFDDPKGKPLQINVRE